MKTAACRRIPDADALAVTTRCGARFTVSLDRAGKPNSIVALTPCCGASGKGSVVASGVVCRKCYREVGEFYGQVGEWERTKIGDHFLSLTPYDLILGGVQLAGCPCATTTCVDYTLWDIERSL